MKKTHFLPLSFSFSLLSFIAATARVAHAALKVCSQSEGNFFPPSLLCSYYYCTTTYTYYYCCTVYPRGREEGERERTKFSFIVVESCSWPLWTELNWGQERERRQGASTLNLITPGYHSLSLSLQYYITL